MPSPLFVLSMFSCIWQTPSAGGYHDAMDVIDEIEALFRLDSISDDEFMEFVSLSLRTIIIYENNTKIDDATLRSAEASRMYRNTKDPYEKALLTQIMAQDAEARGQMWFSADNLY